MSTVEKIQRKIKDLNKVLQYHLQACNWSEVERIEDKLDELKAELERMVI